MSHGIPIDDDERRREQERAWWDRYGATARHLISACLLILMAGIVGCPERRRPDEPTPVETEERVRVAARTYLLEHAEAAEEVATMIDNGVLKGTAEIETHFAGNSARAKEQFARAINSAMTDGEKPSEGPDAKVWREMGRGFRRAVR